MGCSTSSPEPKVVSSTRRQSEVLVGVHVRAEAAYRRQRMAREMEQTVAMRAHLEVEKAKIRKSSIDCGRRPSRPLTSLWEVPEAEKSDEEKKTEERKMISLIVPSGETSPRWKEKIEENIEGKLSNGAVVGENMISTEVKKQSEELTNTKTNKDPEDGVEAIEHTNNNEENADQQRSDEPSMQEKALGTGEVPNPPDQATDSHEQMSNADEEHSEITRNPDNCAVEQEKQLDEQDRNEAECAETNKECSTSLGDDSDHQTISKTGENIREILPSKELQIEPTNGGLIFDEQERLAGDRARVLGPPKLPKISADPSNEKRQNSRDLLQPEIQQASQIADEIH